ncbi:MAG: putative TIM-barrel fold metal-dependent hydrolase [Planctomycetota bacterium]|jgi:predicted TIM-barrel fold metal-dependent hydrolase
MSKRITRRRILMACGVGTAATVATRFALPLLLKPNPVRSIGELSLEAQALVNRAFEGLNRELIWDSHVHVVGLGAGGSGCYVHPDMQSHWHPIQRLQFDLYLAASGVGDWEQADQDYLRRLLALQAAMNPAGKLLVLAFDYTVDEKGIERPELSNFHTPNDYVLKLAEQHAQLLPIASIHPYRKDAAERLETAVSAGAIGVKWLPNAMGIDPSSPLCDAYYAKQAELGVPLITHAGIEKAVHAEENQRLGNPLRLRRALDAGVKVVVAHCAGLGTSLDLDQGAGAEQVPNFDLFMRLMRESKYDGLLFGEISAMVLSNRCGDPLRQLLLTPEIHGRLINGSDYPVIAIDPTVSTHLLEYRDYLDPDDRAPVAEIFDANPLLFDFVLKRILRVNHKGQTFRFAPSVFESARLWQA